MTKLEALNLNYEMAGIPVLTKETVEQQAEERRALGQDAIVAVNEYHGELTYTLMVRC